MSITLPIQDISTPEILRLLCPPGSGYDESLAHPQFEALAFEYFRRRSKDRQRPYWLRYANAYFQQFSN